MRILHTSDWHLGKKLYGRERKDEFESFLSLLIRMISKYEAEGLIIAGDIFDSCTPPVWAQELYFDFLLSLSDTCCCDTVVIGGNHDSPFLLDAPSGILERLNVHVVGSATDPEKEVFLLKNKKGENGAVCAAVPFLRTRDLISSTRGKEEDEIRADVLENFTAHYRAVLEKAGAVAERENLPVIVTGHCFVTGGKVSENEGVRDIRVGSLETVPLSAFTDNFDYLALGHLHSPQICGECEKARYSGAPLAMSFSESGNEKSVLLLDFEGKKTHVTPLKIPAAKHLVSLKGTFEEISSALPDTAELLEDGLPLWVEIICTDEGGMHLNDALREEAAKYPGLEVLRVSVATSDALLKGVDGVTLREDMTPLSVFDIFLGERGIEGEKAEKLRAAYKTVLEEVETE